MAVEKFDKIIEIRGVTKVFSDVTVVDDMSLSIKRGEFVTLLGPSGCGKTTLLRMIAGFETPTSGRIFLEKQDVTGVPPHKRPINTVFQKYALFPHLNVFNNIAFGLKLKRIPSGQFKTDKKTGERTETERKYTKDEITEKVERALKLVNLAGYEKRDVNSLSGGQQQRVAIARAIVLEPKVLLLDEPLGALDLKMRKEMQIELMSIHKNLGITFVYVTHDQEEALTMSDKVVVINDGAIQQTGTPKKIYDEPKNAFVANFIGESNLLSGTVIGDYKVAFCGKTFACEDKGFSKNEQVDLVIRPEDIRLYDANSGKGELDGEVTSSVFKGTNYEMIVATPEYEFTVQSTSGRKAGEKVALAVLPAGIHIMKKMLTVNTFITEVTGENTVSIGGGDFEFNNNGEFERGERVIVEVPFNKISLTDDESDGVIGGNIGQSYYKGAYYQIQVYTDDDSDLYLDTADEWDMDDRVGILIDKDGISVKKYVEEDDGTAAASGDGTNAENGEADEYAEA
ncbi:MAG: ABC transporter ATP-binding protein [Clostridiales bacterium]|jgi:spermidine/putrescine transport system ATP-binding protein|nr:ABC transporter ATP-binding protein [Clostridiales bacterium]